MTRKEKIDYLVTKNNYSHLLIDVIIKYHKDPEKWLNDTFEECKITNELREYLISADKPDSRIIKSFYKRLGLNQLITN